MTFLTNVQQMNIYYQMGIFFLQSRILMPFLTKNYHFLPKKVLLIFLARNWVKQSWYLYSTPFLRLLYKKLETVIFFFQNSWNRAFGLADIWPFIWVVSGIPSSNGLEVTVIWTRLLILWSARMSMKRSWKKFLS